MGAKKLKSKKPLSIKQTVFLIFLGVMVLTLVGIGTMVYTRWTASAMKTTDDISNTIGLSLQNQLGSFMSIPWQINETSHTIIEQQVIDMSSDVQRDRFFVSVLSSFAPYVYSFSYGSGEGHYFGARRNAQDSVEIMRNDEQTGGRSWYYSVTPDLRIAQKIFDAGTFDPRTRPWYKTVEQSGAASFSPVYKHFVMDDMSISAAWPIYNQDNVLQGVLGTHVLLTHIGEYLARAVSPIGGQAVVIERKTGLLVANSLGMKNFSSATDGTFQRLHISALPNKAFAQAFEAGQGSTFQGYQVSMLPLTLPGVDWLVLCAIPNDILFSEVRNTIIITIFLALLAMLAGLFLYNIVAGYLMHPLDQLLEVSKALSEGDLSRRTNLSREDEIGSISSSMNNVADTMQNLINTLESQVKERTEALHENKEQLELLLNSTAEGIYGIDLEGICTFCNQSAVTILGYESQEHIVGKQVHALIHHSHRGGKPRPISECKIFHAIHEGRGIAAEDEVFWRADGTSFVVSYHAYPQIRSGNVVGGVVSFMDITQRRQKEDQIAFLGSHDPLTGLFNRRHFEEQFRLLNKDEYLPLSLIFADLNGLKLTNDIFGHKEGDRLLCQAAEILKQACRGGDVVARIGGDEFILLLPNTNAEQTRQAIYQIRQSIAKTPFETIKCSISLGFDTKTTPDMTLEEIMANAENAMYKDKISNRKHVQHTMLVNLQEKLFARNPKEKEHSKAVGRLSSRLGSALRLTEAEIVTLEKAALVHDIGKISVSEELFAKKVLTDHEYATMQQHAVVGYRILNLFEDTLVLAEVVYSHHERWDGKGYPRGLQGNRIPLLARIIAIAEVYDRVLTDAEGDEHQRTQKARTVIHEGAGTQFDPDLASLFLALLEQEQSNSHNL